jgi:methylisocitrate lyase
MLGRLRAALAARRDPEFVIIARTDAYGAVGGSLDETLRRLEAYAKAGADALMPLVAELGPAALVAERFRGIPLVYISGGAKFRDGDPPASQLSKLGYTVVLYPDLAIADAVMAVDRICRELKQTGNVTYRPEDHLAARQRIFETIGLSEYWKIEAETTERDSPP